MPGRARAVALGLAAATAALASPASLAAAPRGRCNRHSAVRKTRSVLAFYLTTRQYNLYDQQLYDLEVCARPAGRAVNLTTVAAPGPEYPPNRDLRELPLAGDYAGGLVVAGEADATACMMVEPTCPTPSTWVAVADARRRRKAEFRAPDNTAELTLSPAGAAAWLVPAHPGPVALVATRLTAHGAHGLQVSAKQLDQGQISLLRWHGLTLTWNNQGTPHSARIA